MDLKVFMGVLLWAQKSPPIRVEGWARGGAEVAQSGVVRVDTVSVVWFGMQAYYLSGMEAYLNWKNLSKLAGTDTAYWWEPPGIREHYGVLSLTVCCNLRDCVNGNYRGRMFSPLQKGARLLKIASGTILR
jgi:hypothetical protein